MKTIVRVFEGQPVPDHHTVERILTTEEQPIGTGTNTRRVYTILLRDDRYRLSDAQKLDRAS